MLQMMTARFSRLAIGGGAQMVQPGRATLATNDRQKVSETPKMPRSFGDGLLSSYNLFYKDFYANLGPDGMAKFRGPEKKNEFGKNSREIAAKWNSLPLKEKELYKKKAEKHNADTRAKFDRLTLAEQVKAADLDKDKKKALKLRRKHSLQNEYDKPKRPPTNFLRFLADYRLTQPPVDKNLTGKERLKAYGDIVVRGAAEWKKLPESSKKKYSDAHDAEVKTYKLEMEQWEKKMKKEGHEDVLKKLMPAPKKVRKVSARRSGIKKGAKGKKKSAIKTKTSARKGVVKKAKTKTATKTSKTAAAKAKKTTPSKPAH